ncbi:phage regulatory CII family protein [Xanthomonas cannabis]|uniref:phage regulatory CII family protein n=1 Tax=Xanthomonas cannabis TaxID=1885674 RepID=UPI003CCE5E4B
MKDDGREQALSDAVLCNKVSPNTCTHHLTLAEVTQIIGVAGDDRRAGRRTRRHAAAHETPSSGNMLSALLLESSAKGTLARLSASRSRTTGSRRTKPPRVRWHAATPRKWTPTRPHINPCRSTFR